MSRSEIGGRVETLHPGRPLAAVQSAVAAGGADRLSRSQLATLVAVLVRDGLPPSQVGLPGIFTRGSRRVLDWLELQEGDTWAARWDAAGGPDGTGWTTWLRSQSATTRGACRIVIDALVVLQAIRPTSAWLLTAKRARC